MRFLFFTLQLIYWYVIACLVSHPLKKNFKESTGKKEGKHKEKERKMKERIEKDVKHAEELEEKKNKK